MFDVLKNRILKLLEHRDYRPLKSSKLAGQMGVSEKELPEFEKALENLRKSGHIVIGQRDTITLAPLSGKLIGKFRRNPKGFGFVIPDTPSGGDLFIPPDKTKQAMTGDTVKARVVRSKTRRGEKQYSGEILDILQRGQEDIVGTLLRKNKEWFVVPDGNNFTSSIKVKDVSAKNAKPRDKVVVEILNYPTPYKPASGVISRVIGKRGRYESEIQSVMHQFNLQAEFDKDFIEQAKGGANNFDGKPDDSREDVTDKFIITIDPESAKDFDDAISLEKNGDNTVTLGVHIADVSHFIEQGTPLDDEARKRGNSVYLPGRTIPMLPEILSNGICSLQPEEDRYCKSVYLTYDDSGNVVSKRFANSLIRSDKRLTYKQADVILKNQKEGFEQRTIDFLKEMEKLARSIEAKRYKAGMLHLEIPEMEIVMDDSGKVVDAEPADDSYPHTIIEMFMVEANSAVAQMLDSRNKEFVRRIHPQPDVLNMKQLAKVVRSLGINFPKKARRKDVQKLLESVKGGENERAVNLMVLRSLEKAVYSPLDIGHYALALQYYCHFTSPIRRYADLMVHRELDECIRKQTHSRTCSKESLTETAEHISFTERNAADAERELKKVLILQMLKGRLGSELSCFITGITGFGVFVESVKYGVEGLISLDDLGDDHWQVNERKHYLKGKRSGVELRLGQRLNASILSVDIPARKLDFCPAQPLLRSGKKTKDESKSGGKKKRKNKGKKNKKRKNRGK
jgi:ribonuclease R